MTGRSTMLRGYFEPGLRLGQYIVMIDAQAPLQENDTSVFEVTSIEAIPSAGPSGLLGLYASGAAFPAGYTATADKNATLNVAVNAGGGQVGPIAPAALTLARFQLAQARFRTKFINPPAPPSIRDLDVQAYMGNVRRWTAGGGSALTGVINAIMQVPDPNDVVALPAQGAALAIPAAFPSEAAWQEAARTELWWYWNNQPSFALINNNSANAILNAGTFAWFLEMVGFVYGVTPVVSAQTHEVEICGSVIANCPIAISREMLLDGVVQTNFRGPLTTSIVLP